MEAKNIITSAKSGYYNNSTTWVGNKIPNEESTIIIAPSHNVTYNVDAKICGLTISQGATFTFDRLKNCIFSSCENIIVYGKLISRPASSSIKHMITFHEIDESMFMGATPGMSMDIMDSDVGIWVRGNGSLELVGSPKVRYLRLTGPVYKGNEVIVVDQIPTGWAVGDRISIAPTLPITDRNFYTAFDICTIEKIVGRTIYLDKLLEFDHPTVFNPFNNAIYTAEVMNLSNNMMIEGESLIDRSHINIMSTSKQIQTNISIRYMGVPDKLGRYADHLHFCGEGSRGSIFDGVVIEDSGHRGFVFHASHGITAKNCIVHRAYRSPYWWDEPPTTNPFSTINNSNDIIYDSCISAKVMPAYKEYRLHDFTLGSGLRNTVKNCIAIGNMGDYNSAGFGWPESSNHTDNVWIVINNTAHNQREGGTEVWENDKHKHKIDGLLVYHCGGFAMRHGAYTNSYEYSNVYLIDNSEGILLYALPVPGGFVEEYGYISSFKNVLSTGGLHILPHNLPGGGRILFKDCRFSKVIVDELPKAVLTFTPGLFDFVNCDLQPIDFPLLNMETGSLIRVQNYQLAFQINDRAVITEIPVFLKV